MVDFSIPVSVSERAGIARAAEVIRFGIPFPRGVLLAPEAVRAIDSMGRPIPLQGRGLATWPDRSIKWLLVDGLVAVGSRETATVRICRRDGASEPDDRATPSIGLEEDESAFVVHTGAARFRLSRAGPAILTSVSADGIELLQSPGVHAELRSGNGARCLPTVREAFVEESGPLRVTLLQEGIIETQRQGLPLRFAARAAFTAGASAVRLEIRLTNPNAAHHRGGLWDLGDPGSRFFEDFSVRVPLAGQAPDPCWYAESASGRRRSAPGEITIYQDSSGGEQWNSESHVDWQGRVSVDFRGYRVTGPEGELLADGMRAAPCLGVLAGRRCMAAAVQDFWQNFPKALRWDGKALAIGLFPHEARGAFELQGGEQKRHVVFLDFGGDDQCSATEALQNPLEIQVDPTWIEQSGAVPYFSAAGAASDDRYQSYVRNIVEGPDSFFAKREAADEYGWRNFGDLYADHEAVNHRGPGRFVSHYNNQYDFILGAAAQYLRSGDSRWHELMDRAARHTIDIDIYHTDRDKAAYSHGMFWHTDHYRHAATGTHRTYSARNGGKGYGGGPSNEHNYTSGLLLYYYLTGDREAAAAVKELADWVLGMDDGSRTVLGLVDEGPTGAATQTRETGFHKPGRGAGNSINALVDAYRLTGDRGYLSKAEEFIRRCIHPADDIAVLALDDPESRWSYLVFLQVLGKYLALKAEMGEADYWYCYAQDSLLHYARWMLRHEVPYKDVLHKVEIPTETWPAHDIRKCHVFHLASYHAPQELARAYREQAFFFFDRCLDDVMSFETAYLTRPLVIICANGYAHDYFAARDATGRGYVSHGYSFGEPSSFLPQRARLRATAVRKASIVREALARRLADWTARLPLTRGHRR